MNFLEQLRLCLVIGPSDCENNEEKMWKIIRQAITGGVSSIQLRDKKATPEMMRRIAIKLKHILKYFPHILFIINDHVAIAAELQIGLHIGQSDMPYAKARALMGLEAVIGLSIENLAQAERCKTCGATYFGVGPVFETVSKHDAASPLGVIELKKIIDVLSPTPCVAIGGIKIGNIDKLPEGIAGVAVISAIAKAKNPIIAACELNQKLSGNRERAELLTISVKANSTCLRARL